MSDRWIYFARVSGTDGPIKIGCSKDPQVRARALSSWVPFPIELLVVVPGDFWTESRVHGFFADLHVHGEWFTASDSLLTAVNRLQAGEPLDAVVDLNALSSIRHGNTRPRTPDGRARQSAAMKAAWARFRDKRSTWAHPGLAK